MAKKIEIDKNFLSELISKSLSTEDINKEEYKAEMELFDTSFFNMASNKENIKFNSLVDGYLEARDKVIDKPEPARTRKVLFEKTGNSNLNFEDIISQLTESMTDTLNSTFGMLIALQCYEDMTKKSEIKATENYIDTCKKVNKIIDSSTPASPDVS